MKCAKCGEVLGAAPDDIICEVCNETITHEQRGRFREVAAERARQDASLDMLGGGPKEKKP